MTVFAGWNFLTTITSLLSQQVTGKLNLFSITTDYQHVSEIPFRFWHVSASYQQVTGKLNLCPDGNILHISRGSIWIKYFYQVLSYRFLD